MKNTIEWKEPEQQIKQELVSADGRWHISKNQKGREVPSFFLLNYDLLLTPHGTGADYRECFETFIADCDAFTRKVEAVRDEAKAHLQSLLETGKTLARE